MIEYNTAQLLFCVFVSVLSYFVLAKGAHMRVKFFYALFLVFFTLYSGIGGTRVDANLDYMIYYYLYLIAFVVFTRLLYNKSTKNIAVEKTSYALELFLKRYATIIIVIYYVVLLGQLVFPENRIGLLISPPAPDINAHLDFYREGAATSLFYYLEILLSPFFYFSLYNYRHKPSIISLLLSGSLYITYCADTYLGREPILVALVIIYFTIYYNASKKKKKYIITGSLIAAPLGILFFVYYSYMRVGLEAGGISFSDALNLLFSQETDYPTLYDSYISNSGNLIGEYIEWFLLLPFPSFLKMGHGGTLFNELFTNISIGRYSWESGFSIALPGIVGEGVFIFKNLFFIHAFILAFVVKISLKYVCKYPYYIFLYFYALIKIPMGIARSGTQGVYSIIAKALIFVLIMYIYQKINNKHECIR